LINIFLRVPWKQELNLKNLYINTHKKYGRQISPEHKIPSLVTHYKPWKTILSQYSTSSFLLSFIQSDPLPFSNWLKIPSYNGWGSWTKAPLHIFLKSHSTTENNDGQMSISNIDHLRCEFFCFWLIGWILYSLHVC
jgi:hypothetical protein